MVPRNCVKTYVDTSQGMYEGIKGAQKLYKEIHLHFLGMCKEKHGSQKLYKDIL